MSDIITITYEAYKNSIVSFALNAIGKELSQVEIKNLNDTNKVQYFITKKDDFLKISSIIALHSVIFNADKRVLIISKDENAVEESKKYFTDNYTELPNWLKPIGTHFDGNQIILFNGSRVIFSQKNIIEKIEPDLIILNKFDTFEDSKRTAIINDALSAPNRKIIKINE